MRAFLNIVLAVLFILLLLALVSMMMVFIGSEDPQLNTLLAFQNALQIPTLAIALVGLIAYCLRLGWTQGFIELWRRTPAWLIFAAVIVNSLVVSGFLAFHLVTNELGMSAAENELVPLFASLFTSLAFMIVYTHLRQNNPPSTYAQRNKARGSKPLKWGEMWGKK